MKLRNIIIYKRRHLAAVTHFTEKWATTKPGSSCLNLGTYFNSAPDFALQSQLNARKKLIASEMTAQDAVQKWGERRNNGRLNEWPINKTPRLFSIVSTMRAAKRLLCQPGQHQNTAWCCLYFFHAPNYGSLQLLRGPIQLHKCSHSSLEQRYVLLVSVM